MDSLDEDFGLARHTCGTVRCWNHTEKFSLFNLMSKKSISILRSKMGHTKQLSCGYGEVIKSHSVLNVKVFMHKISELFNIETS